MRNLAVFDDYGYVSLCSEKEYEDAYGLMPYEYRPTFKRFDTQEAAAEYGNKQNAYTRNRIQEGI